MCFTHLYLYWGANKIIGDALYLASGAKIMGNINLGNGISVASGSLVNKSFADHELLGGMPAKVLYVCGKYNYKRKIKFCVG